MKIIDDMLTEWRKQFEAEFPMPPDCIWTGKGYAQTHHNAWRAQAYAHMWDGFVAARRTTPDREAIIEECAKVCDDRIMGDQSEGDFEAKRCAEAIRALKTASTISPRDTLIEEIAEMVDHMGEGRRLEEYVGAIREMKSGDKGGA
ncbi:hypothetical protein [Burkholderia vietnamiensis]|uniref:hypothetical protein n=1 Tax=Burkholderia vietnamiensis TaxID=60552 RepID=UPI001B8DE6C0|nr:hypothetical protein [Burkholderia vietnamiensis]MBR8147033.1 hypothetical protein [Burkholderia vietnamiensis]